MFFPRSNALKHSCSTSNGTCDDRFSHKARAERKPSSPIWSHRPASGNVGTYGSIGTHDTYYIIYYLYIQAAALSYPINALVTPAAWHTELPRGKQKLPQVDIRIGTPIWNHHFFNGFNLSIVRFTCRDTASNRTNQYVISMFQMHFPNGTLQKPSFRQIHEQTRKQNPPAWHSDLPQGKEVTPDGGSYWHRHLEV